MRRSAARLMQALDEMNKSHIGGHEGTASGNSIVGVLARGLCRREPLPNTRGHLGIHLPN
jgi:hypothetical protein